MCHGIIIDQEFENKSFPATFEVFAKKKSGDWKIYGIKIDDLEIEDIIKKIQDNMKSDEAWYAHLYNDKELIVIFKDKVFRVTPYISTWGKIINYGKNLGIPDEQLDFWPNRFQDETHYFKSEDFVKNRY